MVAKCVEADEVGLGDDLAAMAGKKEKKGVEEGEMEVPRRTSGRLSKQRVAKTELMKRRVEILGKGDEGISKKKANVYSRRRMNVVNASEVATRDSEVKSEVVENVGVVVEKSAYARVKDTLRLFNKHYLHFVQEEEMRCRKVEVGIKMNKSSKKDKKSTKSSKLKKKFVVEDGAKVKQKAKRPDLKAVSKILESNAVIYPDKQIGELPGIVVGHQFYSRAGMVAIGFHSHWLNGIDYMGLACKKGPLLSGMYDDDLAEDVVYTGQGGYNLTGDKRQIKDQVLQRGNLALKNCVEQRVPVRVIRGHACASSYTGKVYTYDGLYKVVKYWAEKGISGFTVYKFRLRRLEGQPTLTTAQVQFISGRVPQSISEIRGLLAGLNIQVSLSISALKSKPRIRSNTCYEPRVIKDRIKEDVPIPATNLVDDPPVAPTGYTYRKSIQLAKNVKLPTTVSGCYCKGSCVDPRNCACAKRNGTDFPYVHRDGGRLIEAKDVVYEYGPNCGCGPGCVNRTSQRGLRYRLEVFRTPKKGWAVRSWDFIPAGAPVCEYTGVLMRTDDADHLSENYYIFDIDCVQTMRGLGGRERRLKDVSVPAVDICGKPDAQTCESLPEYCIDAGSTGNIARFINHSCSPNLFVQCVLSSHHDMQLARVMVFAFDNIPPLQELTYDYGYALDSVHGPDGKIKQMACYCGARDCRKRMF